MMWQQARVLSIRGQWNGAVEYTCELIDKNVNNEPYPPQSKEASSLLPHCVRALAYPALSGEIHLGDIVLCTVNALAKGLGTGGYAFIVARISGEMTESEQTGEAFGHIVKARYTPMQYMTQAADEQDSPWHEVLAHARSLEGMPVICADVHSSLAPAVLAIKHINPHARIAYIMDDGACQPLWFSRNVSVLRERGFLQASITYGQAFGGDYETISLHTALLTAKHVVNADVAICCQGPGNVGTDTPWGFSGVRVAEMVNAANILGGKAIGLVRMSQADARERHYGISHHTLTALGPACLSDVICPMPLWDDDVYSPFLPEGFISRVNNQMDALVSAYPRIHRMDISIKDLPYVLQASPVKLSTMGRGLSEDAAAFLAAACAGIAACGL